MKQMDNDEFSKAKKIYSALKLYCSEDNKLSPKYDIWIKLYSMIEIYEKRKKVGPPLEDSSHNFSKQVRFSDHLELAFKNGLNVISEMDTFVRDIKENDWNYVN